MKFKADQTYQKLRGGYYTPGNVAEFLCDFAITSHTHTILEPSCGDGAFLEALAGKDSNINAVHAVELDPEEAAKARAAGQFLGKKLSVRSGDYFARNRLSIPAKQYDAVVGNPPYIRYQFLEPSMQVAAESIFKSAGLKFSKHTNSWVTFVIDAVARLNPGGRLAMIIPSELLNVLHAGSLRKYLLLECSKVLVIDNKELVFENALQGTVLLLAQKKVDLAPQVARLCLRVEQDLQYLGKSAKEIFDSSVFEESKATEAKWMPGLLTAAERKVLAKAEGLSAVHRFGDIAQVEVGMVTGANDYFLVSDSTVDEFALHEIVSPMVGRSQHLPGIRYTSKRHLTNRQNDLPVNFVDFSKVAGGKLSAGMRRYIKHGETLGLNNRYKTRIRTPWYIVPSKWVPQLFLLKRSHYVPKLVLNETNALNTDTAYRVSTKVKAADFAFSFYNSLTAISAELEGRSYGGGVLELVPSEIRRLLVPLVKVSQKDLDALDKKLINQEPNAEVLKEQDNIVLSAIGLTKTEIRTIQNARLKLQSRRLRQVNEVTDHA